MYGIDIEDFNMLEERSVFIVSGVHGAGKSTFCRELLKKKSIPYLTPEEIRKETDEKMENTQVYRIIPERAENYFNSGISFLFEHVLSGSYPEKLINKAINYKYFIYLAYIDIGDSAKAEERINGRIQKGGRDIDRSKLESRPTESRMNFIKYREAADVWILFSNSGSFYRKIAECRKNEAIQIFSESEYELFLSVSQFD